MTLMSLSTNFVDAMWSFLVLSMKKLKLSPKFEFERKILFEVLPRPFSVPKAGIWFSIKANTQITFKTSYTTRKIPTKRHPKWILWKRFWKFEKMKCICWVVGGNYKSCENPQIRKWVFYCGQRRLKWEAGMKGEEGPTKFFEKYFLNP